MSPFSVDSNYWVQTPVASVPLPVWKEPLSDSKVISLLKESLTQFQGALLYSLSREKKKKLNPCKVFLYTWAFLFRTLVLILDSQVRFNKADFKNVNSQAAPQAN